MEDHTLAQLLALDGVGVLGETDGGGASVWRVLAIVTAIQGRHELCKDGPHQFLVGVRVLILMRLDHDAQISVAAVFHVQMQVVRLLVMFLLVVVHNVGMVELAQDVELGLELLPLLLGHLRVAYLLAAEDLWTG